MKAASIVLSILLVILLTVTPIATAALSLLDANTITDMAIDILKGTVEQLVEKHTATGYQLNKLSSTKTNETTDGIVEILESYLGIPVGTAELEKVMSTNVVKEILGAYTSDLTGVLTGEQTESALNAEKIKTIVNNNMDEIVQIVKEVKPDMTEQDIKDLKGEINRLIDENAEQIIGALPKAEDIKAQFMSGNSKIGAVLKLLKNKKTAELLLVGVMAVLSVLIFLCRMRGFRGLRLLAVDMFIGGGLNALLCAGLRGSTAVISNIFAEFDLRSVIGPVSATLSNALLIRTVIILAVGVALLAAYIVLKKKCAQKAL